MRRYAIARMAGHEGPTSNCESPLLAEWNTNSKELSASPEALPNDLSADQLFTTLAEWNAYLENHVPYYRDGEHGGLEP